MPPETHIHDHKRCGECAALVNQLADARDESERLRIENARAIAELGKVYQELDKREESHARIHRRAQLAEAALADAQKLAAGVAARGLGRQLMRWYAARLEHERAELMQLVDAAIVGFRELGSGGGDVFAAGFVLQASRTLERMRRNGGARG